MNKIIIGILLYEIINYNYNYNYNKLITESNVSNELKDKIWLVSHGGVGSESMYKKLNLKYSTSIIKSCNRPIKGLVVHFPYPVRKGPKKCIYMYGDIYNSIISQIPRHPDNPMKLINDKNYPKFHNLENLLDYNNEDPFNINKQINQFMTKKVNYPIILLKYGFSEKLLSVLIKELGVQFNYNTRKKRNSNYNDLDKNLLNKLINIYGKLNDIVENSPSLIIRYPNISYNLSQKDVIKYEIKNSLPGKRAKHYIRRGNMEVYNERDVGKKGYGQLRIRFDSKSKFIQRNFQDLVYINRRNGGIEDIRLIEFKMKNYIICNGLENNEKKRNMYIYDIKNDKLVKLWINNYDISNIKIQKNWTPYVFQNNLYLIYSYSELCILRVENLENGMCNCIKGSPLNHNDKFTFIGSTPLIQWNYPYFIGFVHTRKPHRSVPIIYNALKMEVIKYGNVINFKNPKEAIPWRSKSVQFPYDLFIKDEQIILGVEFEDRCPTLIYFDYIGFCKQFSI